MPKVRLNYSISGWCKCTVDVPQSVIDEYNRECDKDNPDEGSLYRLLEPYINLDDMADQLDDPEDIELTEIKEAAQSAELARRCDWTAQSF